MSARSVRNCGKPRVMGRNRLRSDGVRWRWTNKKRSWNKSLIFCWIYWLLRANRRASLSLDDGRPRFNFGLDVAKRSRSLATALKTPWVSSLMRSEEHTSELQSPDHL